MSNVVMTAEVTTFSRLTLTNFEAGKLINEIAAAMQEGSSQQLVVIEVDHIAGSISVEC